MSIEDAVKLHKAGELEAAHKIYESILRLDQKNVSVRYLLSTLFLQLKRYDESLRNIKILLDIDSRHVDGLNILGLLLEEFGDFDGAIDAFNKVLKQDPSHLEASVNIARIFLQQNKTPEAIGILERLPSAKRNEDKVSKLLIDLYEKNGDFERADILMNKFLASFPENVLAHIKAALIKIKIKSYKDADSHFIKALEMDINQVRRLDEVLRGLASDVDVPGFLSRMVEYFPENAHYYYYRLARICEFNGDDITALAYFEKSLRDKVEKGPIFSSLECLKRLRRYQVGIDLIEQVKKVFPDETKLDYEYALFDFLNGNVDRAIQALETLIEKGVVNADILNNLGCAYLEKSSEGNPTRARELITEANKLKPNDPGILNNLGFAWRVRGELDTAAKYLKQAFTIDPANANAKFNYALSKLGLGELEEGWKYYEWRWESWNQKKRPFNYTEWRSGRIDKGNLLVYAEQGLGDEILFSSCIPDLLEQMDNCVIECEERLKPLFLRSFSKAKVVTEREALAGGKMLGVTHQIPVGSLPGIFRKNLSDFNKRSGDAYLVADPARVIYWRERISDLVGGKIVLGFSWGSNITEGLNRAKPYSMDYWENLYRLSDVALVNLQYGDIKSNISYVKDRFGVDVLYFDDINYKDDIDELAALIVALDGVISISNAVAALSGALGKKVFRVRSPVQGEFFRLGQTYYPWYSMSEVIITGENEVDNLIDAIRLSYIDD